MSHSPSALCRKHGARKAAAWIRRLLASVGIGLVASCAFAQQPVANGSSSAVAARYPAGSIDSAAQADNALADVARERAEIEARFSAEQQACHPKFFASSCIEEAKERRRKATMQLRTVEIEANTFKRRARVTERDKALEERQSKDAADREERLKRQAEAENADAMREKSAETEKEKESGRKQATIFPDRQKKHDDKIEQLKAEEAAQAKKRAENVAAYEKKVQDAKERQQAVAEKKAEKERKRAKRTSAQELPK